VGGGQRTRRIRERPHSRRRDRRIPETFIAGLYALSGGRVRIGYGIPGAATFVKTGRGRLRRRFDVRLAAGSDGRGGPAGRVGPHRLTEARNAFTGNGSAMAGLNGNTTFYNLLKTVGTLADALLR
jgi:hypothetical protein